MDTSKADGKRNVEEVVEDDDDEEDDDAEEDNKKKRVISLCGRKVTSIGGSTQPSCQVDCITDLKNAETYHRRHKVCEQHSKSPVGLVAGIEQRFCQQCSRFHELSEFDEAKRSCRRRLAGHNERRRKSSYDTQGEGYN